MKFIETKLKGAFIIECDKWEDERGFFARAWCKSAFEEHGLASCFVQCNIVFSKNKGTVRGLHYQVPPCAETKVVRCTRGAIYDVIIDLRAGSPSCKQWFGLELTSDDGRMIYVPKGFAHGYQTLVDSTEVSYQVSHRYAPECERGVRWDDPLFAIRWPHGKNVVISEKDRNWPNFAL